MGIRSEIASRAVFLDRDGVINRSIVVGGKPYPPSSLEELELLPHVPEALGALRSAGFRLIVVTNQPDVARGKIPRALVDAMHERLRSMLPLDLILACFHDDAHACECRKPKPGLLMEGARLLGVDRSSSFMIGDRWRDVEAGRRAGCKTFFLDYGYDENPPQLVDFRVGSLAEAARIILQREIADEGHS